MGDPIEPDGDVPQLDPLRADPLEGTTTGRGDLPPEELRSFNTTGRMGPAGDIEAGMRSGAAGYDYLRERSVGPAKWAPWLAAVVLFAIFVLPVLLR